MSQDDVPEPMPPAGKVSPEVVALRAQPRPVTRLNRRMLAVLAGGAAAAVLGAMMWTLQPRQRHAPRGPAARIACTGLGRADGQPALRAGAGFDALSGVCGGAAAGNQAAGTAYCL